MNILSDMDCDEIDDDAKPLTNAEVDRMLDKMGKWSTEKHYAIRKKFKFKDFEKAMEFVNAVAEVAEEQKHHPDICIHYNVVEIELTTHELDGLHLNDFIMASKIDMLM